MNYIVKTVKHLLKGGELLLAGCICENDMGESCEEKLGRLAGYEPKARDLVGIDYELASAVSGLFKDLSAVVAAGASIHISDADILSGMTTGGILGDPYVDIESSADESEELKAGFSLMTLSGSPGLVADADPETVKNVLAIINEARNNRWFPDSDPLSDEDKLNQLFESYNINTALMVFDGTGEGTEPLLIAKDSYAVRFIR